MTPKFDYEKSDKRGVKVNRIGGDESGDRDSIKEIVEKGARLEVPQRIACGEAEVRVESSDEVVIKTEGETRGKVRSGGTLEWFGDALIGGKIQAEGGRFDVWQKVVSTGDNLVELNAGVDGASLKAPFSGIEVNRGEGEPDAFLVFPEDTRRWTAVMEGRRRKLAVHGDQLSNFEQDLTTDEIPEGDENKYMRPITSSENFWVSDEVKKTKGTNREILPAFIPSSESEVKRITGSRAKLTAGTCSIQVMASGRPVGDPLKVSGEVKKQNLNHHLEDGNHIGIEVLDSNSARNLSVSISLQTSFT